jgi:hypothetical protein
MRRSQNESLYVMLSPHELPAQTSDTAIRVLLPSIAIPPYVRFHCCHNNNSNKPELETAASNF